jgi:hypothetical protein
MLALHWQSQQASLGRPLPQHDWTPPTIVPVLQCYNAYTASNAIKDLQVRLHLQQY